MAESLFDKYEKEAFRAGVSPRTEESRKWFMDKLKGIKDFNRRSLLKDPNLNKKNTPRIGSMYMYFYDPKHRKTLPYYDTFPLVIMVEPAKGGFYGINLHYLPPVLRAKLLDSLLMTVNNKRYDESTKMKITYKLLASTAKFKYFKPCYKRYLFSQIEASVVRVEPPEWELAVFLPTEQFKKSKKSTVWQDSRKTIRG
tara:strand:+ start:3614 stop:4207 length:594 start_codon:yes stop_codon:yes gene_type:complete